MVRHYLEFEKPLVDLETEIEHLKRFSRDKQIHFSDQIKNLEEKLLRLQREIFLNLTARSLNAKSSGSHPRNERVRSLRNTFWITQ